MPSPRPAWFVDGQYSWNCFRSVVPHGRIDYAAMRRMIEDHADALIDEAYYFNADWDADTAKQDGFYTAISQPPPKGAGLRPKRYWVQRRALNWPRDMGGGPVLHPETGEQFQLTQQKAVDVGLAFHLMRSHARRRWDRLYLVAGDADFAEVVTHLVEGEGVELVLLGTGASLSSDLLPLAREVLYFDDFAPDILLPSRYEETR
jgi:uncharacterized LabA/DUF88 family protein